MAAIVITAVLLSGCTDGSEPRTAPGSNTLTDSSGSDECIAGIQYADTLFGRAVDDHRVQLEMQLGQGIHRVCNEVGPAGQPSRRVTIWSVRGLDPADKVAVWAGDGQLNLYEVDSIEASSSRVSGTVQPTARPQGCGPTSAFFSSGGEQLRVSWLAGRPPTFQLKVGELAFLQASGRCAYTVGATPQNEQVVHRLWRFPGVTEGWAFKGRSPGWTRVAVAMPTCAQPRYSPASGCIGGIAVLGEVRVHVVTRTG